MRRGGKLAAALSVLLAAMTVVSCGTQGTDPVETPAESTSAGISAEMLDLHGYKVIRPEKADGYVVSGAVEVKKALNACGLDDVTIDSDWVKDVSTLPVEACEILVGHTNRPESEEIYKTLREDDRVIKVFPDSGRIVIAGGNSNALDAAVKEFIALAENGSIPADTVISASGKVYDVKSLTINNIPLSSWCVSTGRNADRDVKAAAYLFVLKIKERTGFELTTVTGNIPDGMTAVSFEKNTGSDIVVESPSGGITLSAPGGYIVSAAVSLAEQICPAGSTGDRSATVLPSKKAAVVTDGRSNIATELYGALPVALVDQKNACAAIYDFSEVLTGGQPKVMATFAPTSANGFSLSGYGNRIDEFRVRYSEKTGGLVAGFTSSSGYVALCELPSGKCLWQTSLSGYGPHSIDYIPDGNVAVAMSGNGDESKACIRVYATSSGKKNETKYASVSFTGAHAVIWDDVRGILWAYGYNYVKAYYTGSDPASPELVEIGCYTASVSRGGHDLSSVALNDDLLLLGGNGCVFFNKTTGSVIEMPAGVLSNGSTKCICSLPDGSGGIVLFETVATNVYASHDTDTVNVRVIPASGAGSPQTAVGATQSVAVTFSSRAFYKARVVDPYYNH